MGLLKKSAAKNKPLKTAAKEQFEERVVGGIMRRINKKTGENVADLE